MQPQPHSDPRDKFLCCGLSDGTVKGCKIPNASVTQHHSIVGLQQQVSTQYGTHIPQTSHHGNEVNRRASARETPLYLAAAPVSTSLISRNESQTLQWGQSQPIAMVQSQQAFVINSLQVPVTLSTLANRGLHIGQQPQAGIAKLNNDNRSSAPSSPVPQSQRLGGSKLTQDQISGSIIVNSSLQSSFPGIVTLLVKQSDLNTAVHQGLISNGLISDNHSLKRAPEAVSGVETVKPLPSLYTQQPPNSVLVLNQNYFQNLRSVLDGPPNGIIGLPKPTCFAAVNGVLPLPTTISQSPKAVSFQNWTTSLSGNSSGLHPHGSPTTISQSPKAVSSQLLTTSLSANSSGLLHGSVSDNVHSKSIQSCVDVIHMQGQTFRGQSRMLTQRAVAVVPPIQQQCTDDDGREKENVDKQSIKIQHVWSESAEKSKKKSSESGFNPVIAIDWSSTKSSSDCTRVEHQSSHETVVSNTQCVHNLSQSIEQKPVETEHPEVHDSCTDFRKQKTEETTTEPFQSQSNKVSSDQNHEPLEGKRDDTYVSSRAPILTYSLEMLKKLVADLETEHLKPNGKSDDGPDLVHTLLNLYWGGSSSNYLAAKSSIENTLQEAAKFEVTDESAIFDGINMEDLYKLQGRFDILHKVCDLSSVLNDSSSTCNNDKLEIPDKEPEENRSISKNCGLSSPELEKNVEDDYLSSDTKTKVSPTKGILDLEDPHCSLSAKTSSNNVIESTFGNHGDNGQKSITDLSCMCVNITDDTKAHSSEIQNSPMAEKQDDFDFQKSDNNQPSSSKPDDTLSTGRILSEHVIVIIHDNCEKNDKILRNEPPSPTPSTLEESVDDFSKVKIEVLSPDEVKALSLLFHEDEKERSCTSSQEAAHRHAEDEREPEFVPTQKVKVNQEKGQVQTLDDDTLDLSSRDDGQSSMTLKKLHKVVHNHPTAGNKKVINKKKLQCGSQVETFDNDTLDLSRRDDGQSSMTLKKLHKVVHNCPPAGNKKVINKKKLQCGSQEKSLTLKSAVEPRPTPQKTRNAHTLIGQTTFSKLCHDQRTSRPFLSPAKGLHGAKDSLHQYHPSKSITTPSGKDLTRSTKRALLRFERDDQVVHEPKKSCGLERHYSLPHKVQVKNRLAETATPGELVKDQGQEQSDCPPKMSPSLKLPIASSPVERSAKEKVLRNWVSTYVPTDVRTRRPSDTIEKLGLQRGQPSTCHSLNQVDKRRLQKIKNDARYWTMNRQTEKVGKVTKD